MLSEQMVPTHLVTKRTPIRIRRQLDSARGRVPYLLVQILKLCGALAYLKLRRRLDGHAAGRLLREFCQRMGVLWIKLGQLVSMRADLASPAVRAELSKLQDRVTGFPPEIAIRQIEAALGAPLARYMSEFEETPIAAASVAQVHKARLRREGVWVAVKVRRPGIQELLVKDLWLIRGIARLLEWIRFRPEGRWLEMLWELEEAIREEVDFRYEATNMRRMRRILRPHGIYVPTVFEQYCTPGILVMEFVRGVLMSDYLAVSRSDPQGVAAWREANGFHPLRVARTLLHSLLRQVLEDNLFHGDLHPGNIVLLRDGRIAFLDFGSLGSMERDFVQKVDIYLEAMSSQQYFKMVDIYFLFSDNLPPIDLSECKNEMIRRLQAWDVRTRVPGLPFSQKSFNVMQDDLVMLAARYGVAPIWSFFRMTRAMTTMDASLRELIPHSNVRNLVVAYYRQRTRRLLEKVARKSPNELFNPRDWTELYTRTLESALYRGDIVRRDAAVIEGTTSHFAQFFGRIFGNLARFSFLLGMLFLAVFLFQRGWLRLVIPPDTAFAAMLARIPRLDGQVWGLIFFLLWYGRRRLKDLSRRFWQHEAGPPG
jgi:ubiquinone biosynthesis protein